MGRMVSAKIAKQFGRMIRAWILFAGCTATVAYVVDAEHGIERALHSSSNKNRS
jgi:hypothetical protein